MKLSSTVATALIALATAAAPAITLGQTTCCAPTTNDWPEVNGNLGAQQYSSLTQINQSNINTLGPAWMVHVSAEPITAPVAGPGDNSTANQETTPIEVNGVLYVDTPSGGVIALKGDTGAVVWKWQPSTAANGFGPNTQMHRGVAVGQGMVFTTASGNRVVALNQNTGAIVWAVQPTASDGSTLGTIAKTRTLYYDGMVYQGVDDSNRNAFFALNATNGAMVWYFYSTYPHGTVFTDVNGNTFDAGDTWTTKVTPNDTPNTCYLTGGAAPWQQPTIDPTLGLLYVAFGNIRSCTGAQDGSTRYGTNLFGASLVALDLKTGAYKWHFQGVHHDVWDADQVLVPQLADVTIGGQLKHVIYYGSKSGHQFVLDRTNGLPALPVVERAVPYDTRVNAWPTQPFPTPGAFMETCVTYQNLGSDIPGLPNRAVPNWNGYQAQPDPANPGQRKLVLTEPNYLDAEAPFMAGPPRVGCIYDGSMGSGGSPPGSNFLWLSMSSSNGGGDASVPGFSPGLNMRYIAYSYSPAVHPLAQGGNSLRQIGGYQTGGITAMDASANTIVWKKQTELDSSRWNNPLLTASNLLFITQMDGWLLGMDAATGNLLWRFQTGFPTQSGTITYMINGVQYIAMAAMAGNQPYSQTPNGDAIWAFKLGGNAIYTTGPQASPVVVSGSAEAPTPKPIPQRRPTDNTAAGTVPANTIYLARSNGTATGTKDNTATAGMVPSQLTVPVGTTVTFTNPGDATFGVAGSGNLLAHCATQFFEGLFNFQLQPGQSATYTFNRSGEYFYNDCTSPAPTGKVIVTVAPQAPPSPATVFPSALNLASPTGVFTGVTGNFTLTMPVPAGWTVDQGPVGSSILGQSPPVPSPLSGPSNLPSIGPVIIKTPLTTATFNAAFYALANGILKASFNKADIVNNVPAGSSVPLTFTANFMNSTGVQQQLSSTVNVQVTK
jgi:outer membrane protein assembly factor BamB/plastocyanin